MKKQFCDMFNIPDVRWKTIITFQFGAFGFVYGALAVARYFGGFYG